MKLVEMRFAAKDEVPNQFPTAKNEKYWLIRFALQEAGPRLELTFFMNRQVDAVDAARVAKNWAARMLEDVTAKIADWKMDAEEAKALVEGAK